MEDKVFGELTFRYGWIKTEELTFNGQTFEIRIRTSSKKDDVPTKNQQDSYIKYQNEKDSVLKSEDKNIRDFVMSYSGDISDVLGVQNIDNPLSFLTPKEILFFQNGKYAYIFDTEWSEAGMAILCSPDKIQIGESYILEFEY